MSGRCKKLTVPEAISLVAHEVCKLREQKEKEFEWFKSHAGLATKQDLREMETRMAKTAAELTVDVRLAIAEVKETRAIVVKVGEETGKTLEAVAALNQTILALQKQIEGGATTEELTAAVAELVTEAAATKVQAKATDDLVPDPVVPPA